MNPLSPLIVERVVDEAIALRTSTAFLCKLARVRQPHEIHLICALDARAERQAPRALFRLVVQPNERNGMHAPGRLIGEVSRNGRISKRGNKLTRKHLYEAATTLLTRDIAFSTLKAWASGCR
jgi:hypothetical protein